MADQTGPTADNVKNQQAATASQKQQAEYANSWLQALEDGNKAIEEANKKYENQTEMATKINGLLEDMGSHLSSFKESGKSFLDALKAVRKGSGQAADGVEKLTLSGNKAANMFKILRMGAKALGKTAGGVFKTAMGLTSTFKDIAIGVLDAIVKHLNMVFNLLNSWQACL
jgi:NADH dehydrogenase/NADH:ubiquinone oxidoreductase subunit G